MAGQVMRMPDPSAAARVNQAADAASVQRKCVGCASGASLCPKCAEEEKVRRQPVEEEEESLQTKSTSNQPPVVARAFEQSPSSLRGGGESLPEASRRFFEPRFGQDFSQVRIHRSATAETMAQSLQARAFTMGRDIAFGPRQYAPHTHAGQTLLAHELTHVLQQGAGTRAGSIQRARLETEDGPGSVGAGAGGGGGPAPGLSLVARRIAFNNSGSPDGDNCAASQPASLGAGIGGNIQNCMEMIFRINGTIPAGTEFEILRTRRTAAWERDAANNWTRIEREPAGTNDDHHNADECLRPNAGRIFVVDTPGGAITNPRGAITPGGATVGATATGFAWKLSFAEWVIARNRGLGIGWQTISTPTFSFWHSIHSVLMNAGGTWALANTPGGQPNEIELGSTSTGGATP